MALAILKAKEGDIRKMDRKPIFDTVRVILGRGFAQAEVAMLDRAIDAATRDDPAPEEASAHRLGSLSAKFESGGRGPGAVSSGAGDPGGVSYGTYQLSSKAGTVQAFVANEGRRWAEIFGDAKPGTERFTTAWRAIAAAEGDAFDDAQHAFIARTHYDPAVAGVLADTGLDLDGRHDAVRDATWSVAVQHGGARRILRAAVARADSLHWRASDAYDRALVDAIFDERCAYVARIAGRSAGAVRRTLENVVRGRYPEERAMALAMFEREHVPA
ncbi:VgrG-related protein [Novosphingobium marinum]|nr:hypothetical protein [Novosphingobium marinum]